FVQSQQDQTDEVLVMNPTHPLLAGADRSAYEHLEGHHHLLESAAFLVEHHANPDDNDADAMARCGIGGSLPLDAEPGQNVIAGRTVFVQLLIPMRAVIPDG